MTDKLHDPIYADVTKYCDKTKRETPAPDNTDDTDDDSEMYGLPFVSNINSNTDLCRHPEYGIIHSTFNNPTTFKLIEGFVPIISTSAPSTMSDILAPAAAYIEPRFLYEENHDTPWSQKRKNLYWAGSTTGGWAMDDRLFQGHRQRFVKFIQRLEPQKFYYLRERSGKIYRQVSTFLNSRLFDVAFTGYPVQCEGQGCREEKFYFNWKGWQNKDKPLQSQLVFDMDGNGMSGRWYKFLASTSTPLKQTIFREWHDERLIPWAHYIPVSQSMEELPEMVFFLTSTERGQQLSRRIAEQGRDWYRRAFRVEDMAVYTYRLMLEIARLQNPTRAAM